MALFEQVSNDIKEAMKARDKVRLDTLRNIKKVFLEAKTAPGANDLLEDADALKILQKLAKQGREAAVTFVQQGRQDLADEELAQVRVIDEYLPQPIAQTGVSSSTEMGKVMGLASKQMAGRAEGGAISAVVKRLLS